MLSISQREPSGATRLIQPPGATGWLYAADIPELRDALQDDPSEWIAADEADYLRIAAELVADPARLSAQSAALRSDLQSSLLTDHRTQATRFGAALLELAKPREIPAAA